MRGRGGPAVRPYHAARVAWAARGALTWPLGGARGRGRASCPTGPGGAPGACEGVGTRAGQRGGPRPRRAGGGVGGLGPRARGAATSPAVRAGPERGRLHAISHGGWPLGTAVWWMRGHLMPTGEGGRGDARCRRKGTRIADNQDAVSRLSSRLSISRNRQGNYGPRRGSPIAGSRSVRAAAPPWHRLPMG